MKKKVIVQPFAERRGQKKPYIPPPSYVTVQIMELGVKYQGRVATTGDVEFIKKLIAENPRDSRRSISKKLCKAWRWVQANGALRDADTVKEPTVRYVLVTEVITALSLLPGC